MRDLGPPAADAWQSDPAPSDVPTGRVEDARTRLSRDPAPPHDSDAASGLFARTKVAVERERASAERVGAWTHVLKTPQELSASQDGWWRRLVQRPFRFGRPKSAKNELAVGREGSDATPRLIAGRTGHRNAGGEGWPQRDGTVFILGSCVGVLVTGLLFGGPLVLPEIGITSEWASWPVTAEERQADPERGELPIGWLLDPVGQGVPEFKLPAGERRTPNANVARLGDADHGNRQPPAAAKALEILIGAGQSRSTSSDLLTGEPGYPKPVLKPRGLVPKPTD